MQQVTTYYSNRLSVPLTPVLPAKMWYKAEYGVTYNTAGELTEWQDASGNGFHVFPSGGKATVSPDLMNGHSMVRVVDKLSTLRNCGITGNMPRTVYFLGRLVAGYVIVSCGISGHGKLFECMNFRNIPILHTWGNGMDNRRSLAAQPVNDLALWAWRYNGAGGFSDFNANRGTEDGLPYLSGSNTVDTPFNFAWGDFYRGGTVDILEVLVYDRFLNEQEDQQVRSYLGTKGNVPFNPIPLQPPQGWWQADKDWITDSNGILMQWKDQSGNNRHLLPEPSFMPPSLEKTWVNGKPAARFNGSSRLSVLNLQLLPAPKVYTLILTLQKEPGNNVMPATFGADLEHANNLCFTPNFFGLNNFNNTLWGVGGAEAALTRPLVIAVEIHNANVPAFKLWFNNKLQIASDVLGNGYKNNSLDSFFRLGGNIFLGHGAYFWQGWIAEAILYNRVLTEDEHSKTFEYLRDKYSIQLITNTPL